MVQDLTHDTAMQARPAQQASGSGRAALATTLVDIVMRDHPATIAVFLRHRMGCPGCPIGCFHTVEDACREHRLPLAEFMTALDAAMDRAG
jgi:hybrid cluster-associated redox disulfide protein